MIMAVARKFIDIGANLTDPMYQGLYHGSKKHEPDLNQMLERAWASGLEKIIITGGSLEDSFKALKLAKTHEKLYTTVGCHPTRCNEFEASGDAISYLSSLQDLALGEGKGKVVAIGECGLDYDRLNFCPKEMQKRYFEFQLSLSEVTKLPLFLHCRNAAEDFIEILTHNKDKLNGGVVHSFDGTEEHAKAVLDLGYHIGINGCSLKTEENLKTVCTLPLERLMIETDCPWCEVKSTHAGAKYVKTTFPSVKKEKWQSDKLVKGRNEPANIVQILEILAAVRKEDPEVMCNTIYNNTMKLFFQDL